MNIYPPCKDLTAPNLLLLFDSLHAKYINDKVWDIYIQVFLTKSNYQPKT